MEFTAPTRWRCLNPASALMALTMSWQSSNTPSTAMLTIDGSLSENIWACWNGVIRPAGESMKTVTPGLPWSAYMADDPVSPLVAPTTVRVSPRRSSS